MNEFLKTLSSSDGINGAVGFLLYFFAEYVWPGFKDYDPWAKRRLTMILSFIIPVVATVALVAQGVTPFSPDVIWSALAAGFTAFFVSQGTHGVFDLTKSVTTTTAIAPPFDKEVFRAQSAVATPPPTQPDEVVTPPDKPKE